MKQISNKSGYLEIDLALYHLVIVVCWEMSLTDIVKLGIKKGVGKGRFTREWLEGSGESMKRALGFCTTYGDDNSDVLIWLRNKPRTAKEYGYLYHEISHAVDRIAVNRDFNSRFFDSEGHSEPRAYLLEYIITECNQHLWPKAPKKA